MHITTIHPNTSYIKCDICNYSSKKEKNLSNHIRAVHNDIRDKNSDGGKLRTHRKRKHKPASKDGQVNINSFECKSCDYKTGIKLQLTRHLRTVHKHDKVINCKQFNYQAGSTTELNRHIDTLHKTPKHFNS